MRRSESPTLSKGAKRQAEKDDDASGPLHTITPSGDPSIGRWASITVGKRETGAGR